MGDGNDRIELAETFGEAARALRAEDDVDATLAKLVHLAVETLDACQHAGISLIKRRRVTSGPRTDDVPATIDDLQNEVGEGPCLDAIKEQDTFHPHRAALTGGTMARLRSAGPRRDGGGEHPVAAALHRRGHHGSAQPLLEAGRCVQ